MEYFTTKNKFVEIRATERFPRHPLLRLGDAPKPGGRWASRPKSLTSPRDVTCPALRFRVKAAAAVSNAEAFSDSHRDALSETQLRCCGAGSLRGKTARALRGYGKGRRGLGGRGPGFLARRRLPRARQTSPSASPETGPRGRCRQGFSHAVSPQSPRSESRNGRRLSPPPRGCRREGGTIAGVSLEAVTPSGTNGRRDPHHPRTGKKRCFRCPSHLSSRPPQTSPGTSKRRLLREARPHLLSGGRRPCLLLGPTSVHLLVSVSVKSELLTTEAQGLTAPSGDAPGRWGRAAGTEGRGTSVNLLTEAD